MWSPKQQLMLLTQSLRTARSVKLPKDPESAIPLLLPMVFANQHKSLNDLLSCSSFDVNYCFGRAQRTLLHVAANCGHIECLSVLLELGGDANVKDLSGSTALHLAAKNGQKRCVEKLLEHGGDPNLQGNDGATTIHWLATNGRHGILKSVLATTSQVNILDYHGHSPLHAAARNGHVKAMEILISAGADVNFSSEQGFTPLHAACSTGQRDAITMLIGKQVSIKPDASGVTPLDLCIQGGYGVASEILIKIDASSFHCFLHKSVRNLKIDFKKILECTKYLFTTDLLDILHEKIAENFVNCGFELLSLSTDYSATVQYLHRCRDLFLSLKNLDSLGKSKYAGKLYEKNLGKLIPLWKAVEDWLTLLHTEAMAITDKSLQSNDSSELLIPKINERLCAIISTMHACTKQGNEAQKNVSVSFYGVIKRHVDVLKCFIRLNPNIVFQHFSFVFSSRDLLSFFLPQIKSQPVALRYKWFYENLDYPVAMDSQSLSVFKINRHNIFEDSCNLISDMEVQTIKQWISIQFKEEEAVGDGVMREWLSLLSVEIMNPQYGLFSPSADGCAFQPNRHSGVNPDHLSYFKFAGRILGFALYRHHIVNITFTSSFYKHLLGIKVSYKDVASIDPEYARNLQWILDNDITDLGLELSFVVETDVFGVMQLIELKENGLNISVTEQNKGEYVQLVTELRMTRAIQQQINAFKNGFYEFIPENLLQMFDAEELKTMMSGLSKLDVEYLKSLTSYSGCYHKGHQVIQWLWKCIEIMSDNEQTLLLMFVTGCPRLPPPFLTDHIAKFVVSHELSSQDKIPTASTCMNMLKLPEYSSFQLLQEKLLIAIKCGSVGYAFT